MRRIGVIARPAPVDPVLVTKDAGADSGAIAGAASAPVLGSGASGKLVRFSPMRLLPILLLASACAAEKEGPSGGETDLARELAGRTAGEPRDCVSTFAGSSLTARGPQTLVYERGDTLWVNRLRAECPGLDAWSLIVIQAHGTQYCRGDRFRTREPGLGIPGPICVLGSFTPYRR